MTRLSELRQHSLTNLQTLYSAVGSERLLYVWHGEHCALGTIEEVNAKTVWVIEPPSKNSDAIDRVIRLDDITEVVDFGSVGTVMYNSDALWLSEEV